MLQSYALHSSAALDSRVEVFFRIKTFLANPKNIQKYILDFEIQKQKIILSKVSKLELKNNFIRTILSKVVLYKEKVEIILCKEQLLKALEAITYDTPFPEELKEETKEAIFITQHIRISATANKGSVLIISDSKRSEVNVNSQLIKVITRSYYWNDLLLTGEAQNSIDIQKMEKLGSKTYINNILELRFLAADIVDKILNGTQSRDLTVAKLFKIRTLDWEEQRRLLQFRKPPPKTQTENFA